MQDVLKQYSRKKLKIIWKDRKRTFLGLPWSFTRYSIADNRLFIKTGFFKLLTEETELYSITDIRLTETFGQRIFNIGTIDIIANDESTPNIKLKSVKHPYEVKDLIMDYAKKAQEARGVVISEIHATAGK